MSSWAGSLATLITNAMPSNVRQQVITKLNDVYNTCNVNMDLTNGALKTSTSVATPTTAGLLSGNKTTLTLEYDDGTNIHPMNYHTEGEVDKDVATTTTTLMTFDLKTALGSANLVYKSDISVEIHLRWLPSAIDETLAIKSTSNSNYTSGATTRATSIPSGDTNARNVVIEAKVQNLAVNELYWSVVPSGAGLVGTSAGQMYYQIHGRKNT